MRRRYTVAGRVQGVGFRYFVQRQAVRLHLSGWVRNAEDGTVEVEAAGTPEQLAKFAVELRRGPRAAQVTSLQGVEVPDDTGSTGSFEVV